MQTISIRQLHIQKNNIKIVCTDRLHCGLNGIGIGNGVSHLLEHAGNKGTNRIFVVNYEYVCHVRRYLVS